MELNPDIIVDQEPISALWAVDPKEVNIRPSSEALAEIKHFLGGAFTQLHSIYICADKEESPAEAKLRMLEFLYPLNLGQTLPPEVCHYPASTRTEWVEIILDCAHDHNDKIILITSHGRSAIGTFFLGSFASEILQKSDIPILFLSSYRFKERGGHRALFATDLSENSRTAFMVFLDFVKGKTSEVFLCHIVKLPLEPTLEKAAKMKKTMSLPDYFVEYKKEWARVEIEEFLAEINTDQFNIKVLQVVEASKGALSHSIEKIVKREGVRLVGVATHGKPFENFWQRSVTQGLLSSQKFNLWVCGPRCLSAQKR